MIPPFDENGNIPPQDDLYKPNLDEFIDRFVNVEHIETRKGLFSNYNRYCRRFKRILTKIWIDGSFTTEKLKPADIDLTVHYDVFKCDNLKIFPFLEKSKFFDKSYVKKEYNCHTQYVPVYPKDDLRYKLTEIQVKAWQKHFTKDRSGNPKGLIELNLP